MKQSPHSSWIISNLTGMFHYHLPSPSSHAYDTNDHIFISFCTKHRVSSYHYVEKRKWKLKNIKNPDKICKECLRRSGKKINIFDYIDNLEKEIEFIDEALKCIVYPFITEIPNIET